MIDGRPAARQQRTSSWLVTLVVVGIAGTLRLVGITHPHGIMFDETYYAREAWSMLRHGVEWKNGQAEYVVHPPLGKWLIALGELVYGDNALGWRIASALAGTVAIWLLIRLAYRLFGSVVLAGTAGLLVTLDGMQLVLSRAALLDVFVMLFVLAGFACVVADRARRRRRPDAVPWWRVAAGVMIGCSCAVKWEGLWYLVLLAALIVWWEIGLRRSTGAAHPWRDGLRSGGGWSLAFVGTAVVAYLVSWAGWFATDSGYDRHWLRAHGRAEPPVLGALYNLWQYHRTMFGFDVTLAAKHPYQSWPWQWLLLGRPVLFYSDFKTHACGTASCASEVLLLGTPLLWWSFLPALAVLGWLAVARRDWRATAIGLAAAAGIVPWFWYEQDNRTMFIFYALPSEPFLVLAVVYVLGAMIGPAQPRGAPVSDRRLFGVTAATLYVTLVALTFAYFYPLYVGRILTYAQWQARMWLGARWY